jgi:Transposase
MTLRTKHLRPTEAWACLPRPFRRGIAWFAIPAAARIAAYCKPENKVSLGFVEGLNNKIRVFQRRAYGLRDKEYLRLKVLSCMLPPL